MNKISNEAERNRTVDLIKFIASIMVVILHAFGVGKGAREYVYLIGTFGIPLFFLVNGYLLGNRTLSMEYALKKTVRYFLFVGVWSLLYSIPYLIKKEFPLLEVYKGAIIGSGALYHFWFLTGLCVIYFLVAIFTLILNLFHINIQELVKKDRCIWVVFISMMAAFGLNMFMKYYLNLEIRDVLSAPFRIIDNGAYFIIGMHLRLNQDIREKSFLKTFCGSKGLTIGCGVILICYIAVIIMSNLTGMIWASTYYTFPAVALAVMLMFSLLIRINSDVISDNLYKILVTSSGIWILHPLVLKVVKKLYQILVGDPICIAGTVVIFISTIVISIIVSVCMSRIKYAKKITRP